jgi:hypothetical protein
VVFPQPGGPYTNQAGCGIPLTHQRLNFLDRDKVMGQEVSKMTNDEWMNLSTKLLYLESRYVNFLDSFKSRRSFNELDDIRDGILWNQYVWFEKHIADIKNPEYQDFLQQYQARMRKHRKLYLIYKTQRLWRQKNGSPTGSKRGSF